MKSKIFLLLSTAVLLLGTCATYRPFTEPAVYTEGTGTEAIGPGEDFGLLVWNIHKETDGEAFQEELLGLIEEYDPELLLFQEYRQNDDFHALLTEKRGRELNFAPNLTENGVPCGVLTASVWPSTHSRGMLSTATEPFSETPKALLITRYPLDKTEESLLVVNLHGINFHTGTEELRRQIEDAAAVVQHHRGPVLWAGDINTWSAARLQLFDDIMERLGLQPVIFPEPKKVKKVFGFPLDHIYYNAYLLPEGPEVLTHYHTSDHAPLFVRFKIIFPD